MGISYLAGIEDMDKSCAPLKDGSDLVNKVIIVYFLSHLNCCTQ